MTVTELAKKFDISADAVRHYCKLKLLKPARSAENGYRYFSHEDEKRLRFLLRAKQLGFSLNDIRSIIEIAENGSPTCPVARSILEKRIENIRSEISERQRLLAGMETAARVWRDSPDPEFGHEQICGLIEGWNNGAAP